MLLNTTTKNGSFVALNHDELANVLRDTFTGSTIRTWTNPMRGKRAAAAGGGSRSLFRIALDQNVAILPGDEARPMVQVRDQTVPGAALRVDLGLYRLVCSNGLMAFTDSFTALRIPHIPSRRGQLEAIIETTVASLARLNDTVAIARELGSRVVSDPIAVLDQLQLPKRVHGLSKLLIETNAHRPEDRPNTVWGLYNIVNEVDTFKSRSVFATLARDEGMLQRIAALAE